MISKVFIVWCLLSEICSADFVLISTGTYFNGCVGECNTRGLELLTMSEYRQYLDAQEYFDPPKTRQVSWVALELNTTTGDIHWLNGRVLTELKWKLGEPKNTTGTDCGVMDISSRQWYTTPCTDSRHYLCIGSDGSYSSSSVGTDFYTALSNCHVEGRRLPVAITNLDTSRLNASISSTSISTDFWLGLIEFGTQYGAYFRWVTGEHLTPPHTWQDNIRLTPAFYFHTNKFRDDKVFDRCTACAGTCVCQTKSETGTADFTETMLSIMTPATPVAPVAPLTPVTQVTPVYTSGNFVFVFNNKDVLGSIRKTTTFNPLRRLQCALECLRDAGCIQYTIQGYLCRTYGEIVLITEDSEGSMLWQRKFLPV